MMTATTQRNLQSARSAPGPPGVKKVASGPEMPEEKGSSGIMRFSPTAESSIQVAASTAQRRGNCFTNDEETLADPNILTSKKSSWSHITLLLISEYVGYATLCLPWVFSRMGIALGTTCLILNVLLYIASSLVLWQFCVRHPEVKDIVDIVAFVTKDGCWVMRFFKGLTSVFFYSITIAVMAFHIVSGAEFIDVATHSWAPSCKNIILSVLAVLPCFALSLVRSFPLLSKLSIVAGVCTYASLIMACVFLAVQDKHTGVVPLSKRPIVTVGPATDVTFVELMVAFLTISFATNGSVTIPTFVRDMKDPKDFPKALFLSSAVVLGTFAVFGGVIYSEIGTQYMSIPAISTLNWKAKLSVFGFMVPTIVFLGALYAAVLARRAYTRVAALIHRKRPGVEPTETRTNCLWVAILVTVWAAAWLVAGIIPFFSGLTSIVAAVFVSTFGFIIPPILWLAMQVDDLENRQNSLRRNLAILMSLLFWTSMFLFGLCFMGAAGLYASIWNLLQEFKETGVGRPFACHSGCYSQAS